MTHDEVFDATQQLINQAACDRKHGVLGLFKLNDHHSIKLTRDDQVVCETCSLPFTVAQGIRFMRDNQIHKLTIDGAELVRIY